MRLNSLSPVEGCLVMGEGTVNIRVDRVEGTLVTGELVLLLCSLGGDVDAFTGGVTGGFLASEVALGLLETLDQAEPY